MSDHLDTPFTRRLFLKQGMTFVSLAATAPAFLQRSAWSMMLPLGAQTSSQPGVPEHRILVVVQLAGGNDGLNSVVPYASREYYVRRPGLAIVPPGRPGGALSLDEDQGIGLHPNLTGFKALMDEGVACAVQGVGYPNPNRSHFASMDIWQTADTEGRGRGWLGKYLDCTCKGSPEGQAAIAIGRDAPLALMGDIQQPVSFESAELFRWLGEDLHESLKAPYQHLNRPVALPSNEPDQLGFLLRTALDAQLSSDKIRAAVARRPLVSYPGGKLARQLQVVAAMIRDGLKTRIYYVSLGGFDTHANQSQTHANLMRQLGDSLQSFHKDLQAQGNSGRVLTMVFSEFGRRVGQNGSGGTDHGTAAPMYFVGDMVKPGLLGSHPSLTDLDQGDLRYTADFRSVYAAVIEDWMGGDSAKVLGGEFRKAALF